MHFRKDFFYHTNNYNIHFSTCQSYFIVTIDMERLQAFPKEKCMYISEKVLLHLMSTCHIFICRYPGAWFEYEKKNPRDRQISCEGKKESNLQIGFIPKRKVNWRSKRNRMRQDFPWQMGTPHFFRGNKIRVQNERYWSLENRWYKNMKTYPFALPILKFSALKVIAQEIKTETFVTWPYGCVFRKWNRANNQRTAQVPPRFSELNFFSNTIQRANHDHNCSNRLNGSTLNCVEFQH